MIITKCDQSIVLNAAQSSSIEKEGNAHMSRIGISSNLQQPNSQCLQCKNWEPTTQFAYGLTIAGHCKSGYCKKQKRGNIYGKNR